MLSKLPLITFIPDLLLLRLIIGALYVTYLNQLGMGLDL